MADYGGLWRIHFNNRYIRLLMVASQPFQGAFLVTRLAIFERTLCTPRHETQHLEH